MKRKLLNPILDCLLKGQMVSTSYFVFSFILFFSFHLIFRNLFIRHRHWQICTFLHANMLAATHSLRRIVNLLVILHITCLSESGAVKSWTCVTFLRCGCSVTDALQSSETNGLVLCLTLCPFLPPSLPPSLHFSSLPFALFVSSLSLHLFDSFFLALFKRESHVYVIFVTFDFCLSFYCPQPFTGFATGLYCEVCACVICSRDTGFATDLYCEMCARYTTFHLQGVATSPRGRYILGNSR
jgi:hypothetical protein